MSVLRTTRLELVPITLEIVEAVVAGKREAVEALLGAEIPHAWPGRALIERAFYADVESIRREPAVRLWGDRVMLTHERGSTGRPRAVGSVIFHGAPGGDGIVEVAYGVEGDSQRQGYASEAVAISVEWALEDPGVHVVRAATPSWHVASRRVLEKCRFCVCGTRESPIGDLDEWERRR